MMQSRHQATPVASSEPRPVNMTAPMVGMAWNQPAMPSIMVRLPQPARKGQGEAGRMWKGCAWLGSRCTPSDELPIMRRAAAEASDVLRCGHAIKYVLVCV